MFCKINLLLYSAGLAPSNGKGKNKKREIKTCGHNDKKNLRHAEKAEGKRNRKERNCGKRKNKNNRKPPRASISPKAKEKSAKNKGCKDCSKGKEKANKRVCGTESFKNAKRNADG